MTDEEVIDATRRWVDRAVIGLNLCPFAGAAQASNGIHYEVSDAASADDLVADLERELLALVAVDAADRETTLLIHPRMLKDFLEYNDFLDVADALLEALDLEGVIQIASFHPDYQFAESEPDAIENFTNRSPYPTLHLLREASIERAVDSIEDTSAIFEKNVQTLRRIGRAGWEQLFHDD
jgi:uncharacterized protein